MHTIENLQGPEVEPSKKKQDICLFSCSLSLSPLMSASLLFLPGAQLDVKKKKQKNFKTFGESIYLRNLLNVFLHETWRKKGLFCFDHFFIFKPASLPKSIPNSCHDTPKMSSTRLRKESGKNKRDPKQRALQRKREKKCSHRTASEQREKRNPDEPKRTHILHLEACQTMRKIDYFALRLDPHGWLRGEESRHQGPKDPRRYSPRFVLVLGIPGLVHIWSWKDRAVA